MAKTYRAEWIFPVDRPPLRHGCVTVEGGRIVAIGPRETATGEIHDLGQVALLPELVNAHTHLEFSALNAPLGFPGQRFDEWIRAVVAYRRERAAEKCVSTVSQGLREVTSCGTAFVGEIATPGFASAPFESSSIGGTVFLEMLGLSPEREADLLSLADAHLRRKAIGSFQVGLSPHAPYTVGPALLGKLVSLAAAHAAPLTMHLAESLAELELLQSHSGPLVDMLREFDAWHPGTSPRGMRPLDYLELLAQAPRALVIHGNFLTAEEIAFIGARRESMGVVYCPRTFARFQGSGYPLTEMLAAGAWVALGTDSRSTNPDLSVWAEMQFLFAQGDVPPETILRMATLHGKKTLGLGGDFGGLAVGCPARFTQVPLLTLNGGDAHEMLLRSATPALYDVSRFC